VVRGVALEQHAGLREVLDALGGTISEDDMRRMNYALDGEHRDVTSVVRDFRAAHHL
jgi:glycine betaine/choline ABC-type transport system substrate-binding protein